MSMRTAYNAERYATEKAATSSSVGWTMAHDAVLVEVCHLVEGPDGIPGAKADWKPHVADHHNVFDV